MLYIPGHPHKPEYSNTRIYSCRIYWRGLFWPSVSKKEKRKEKRNYSCRMKFDHLINDTMDSPTCQISTADSCMCKWRKVMQVARSSKNWLRCTSTVVVFSREIYIYIYTRPSKSEYSNPGFHSCRMKFHHIIYDTIDSRTCLISTVNYCVSKWENLTYIYRCWDTWLGWTKVSCLEAGVDSFGGWVPIKKITQGRPNECQVLQLGITIKSIDRSQEN